MYSQHSFEVKTLRYSTDNEYPYGSNSPGYTVNYFKEFAIGKQPRVEHKSDTYSTHTINIPASGYDWVKKLVIEFCPSLNFGWLTPNYRVIDCKKKVVNHNTYWNVIPVDPSKKYHDRYLLTEVQWLTTIPYTFGEKYDAECKIRDLIYSKTKFAWNTPKQLAAIAVYKSFEED